MSKELIILGAGESGTGAAMLAKSKGLNVFVSDFGSIREKYKHMLTSAGIEWEEGQHSKRRILNALEIIKSPGIPDFAEIVREIKASNIPIIDELEFAARHTKGKIIAITGSNGKTTTANLVYRILKEEGLDVELCGNVGQSMASAIAKKDYDYFVVEMSSFQLDYIQNFKADIAILLNITPDHLDRYENKLENYIRSKFRIIKNQTSQEAFIFCGDDPIILHEINAMQIPSKKYEFVLHGKTDNGAMISNNKITVVNNGKNTFDMDIYELALQGKHNQYNSMAAAIAGSLLSIRKESIRQSLQNFKGVEHRLEYVNSVHGIEFINDSKATNINSTWYALESMNKPVIWIAGGVDKGNDYEELVELVKEKVKAIVCLGKDNQRIQEAFAGKTQTITEAGSMREAVRSAYYLGKDGDIVLLSPACASFDLFENYEDRGRQFKQQVREL